MKKTKASAHTEDVPRSLYHNNPFLSPINNGILGFTPSDLEEKPMGTMRVMSVLSLLTGAALAVLGLLDHRDLSALAILCSVFVGPAFIGKAAQKHIELRGNKQ